jgi:hypothetical protein
MNTTRASIALFAAGIVVSVGSRAWAASPLGTAEALYGGILFSGVLWLLGAYLGYRAIRAERRG